MCAKTKGCVLDVKSAYVSETGSLSLFLAKHIPLHLPLATLVSIVVSLSRIAQTDSGFCRCPFQSIVVSGNDRHLFLIRRKLLQKTRQSLNELIHKSHTHTHTIPKYSLNLKFFLVLKKILKLFLLCIVDTIYIIWYFAIGMLS